MTGSLELSANSEVQDAFEGLRLSSDDLRILARPGFIARESRPGREAFYKLRWRRGKRQCVRYLGSDPTHIKKVRAVLDTLQRPHRTACQLMKLMKEARKHLHKVKEFMEPFAEERGCGYHGYHLRRPRSSAPLEDATTPEPRPAADLNPMDNFLTLREDGPHERDPQPGVVRAPQHFTNTSPNTSHPGTAPGFGANVPNPGDGASGPAGRQSWGRQCPLLDGIFPRAGALDSDASGRGPSSNEGREKRMQDAEPSLKLVRRLDRLAQLDRRLSNPLKTEGNVRNIFSGAFVGGGKSWGAPSLWTQAPTVLTPGDAKYSKFDTPMRWRPVSRQPMGAPNRRSVPRRPWVTATNPCSTCERWLRAAPVVLARRFQIGSPTPQAPPRRSLIATRLTLPRRRLTARLQPHENRREDQVNLSRPCRGWRKVMEAPAAWAPRNRLESRSLRRVD
jgi:hypothetical protein